MTMQTPCSHQALESLRKLRTEKAQEVGMSTGMRMGF